MIKLRKEPEPKILTASGAVWLKVLQDKVSAGETPTDIEKSRYRHPEIKAALTAETHGKCAYCESHILHIAYGDVDHIAPKSLKLADTFRWDNLTLACDVCNTYKKDRSDLIDPYNDDPAEFFRFLGPMVYAHPGNGKGVVTAKQLRLNRPYLIESRLRRLDAITSILSTIEATDDPSVRAVLIEDLLDNEAADQGEYAAVVRSFLTAVGFHLTQRAVWLATTEDLL